MCDVSFGFLKKSRDGCDREEEKARAVSGAFDSVHELNRKCGWRYGQVVHMILHTLENFGEWRTEEKIFTPLLTRVRDEVNPRETKIMFWVLNKQKVSFYDKFIFFLLRKRDYEFFFVQ